MASDHKSSLKLGIQAIGRMLEVRRSMGVTELAQQLGIAKSSAHDLLQSLRELGFVEQDSKTARYAISPEIFQFVHQIAAQFGANSKLHDFIREEAARLRCSIYVGTLSGRNTYVLCAAGPRADTTTLGVRTPAFMSSIGRILIAQLPRERWAEYGPQPGDTKLTEWTNLDPKRHLAAVERAARDGVAWNEQETGRGICSVAAPLLEGDGPARRAVGIVHSYTDWVALDKEELAAMVKTLAEKISQLLAPVLLRRATVKKAAPK
ncbi:MAG: IclR family transcriptional regulator [Limisphaerales bacterium]